MESIFTPNYNSLIDKLNATDINIPEHSFRSALTHKSLKLESEQGVTTYEKLVPIGGALIELYTSIFGYYSDLDFKKYSLFKNMIININNLEDSARKIELEKYIILSEGERRNNPDFSSIILSDSLKAIIGILFLYSNLNYNRMNQILEKLFGEKVKSYLEASLNQDLLFISNPKGKLQEITQSMNKQLPKYEVAKIEGPDHDRFYHVDLILDENKFSTGKGRTKKEAEQDAARQAVIKLRPDYLNAKVSIGKEEFKSIKNEFRSKDDKNKSKIKLEIDSLYEEMEMIEHELLNISSKRDALLEEINNLEEQEKILSELNKELKIEVHQNLKFIQKEDDLKKIFGLILKNSNQKVSFNPEIGERKIFDADYLKQYFYDSKILKSLQIFLSTSVSASYLEDELDNFMKMIESLGHLQNTVHMEADASWMAPQVFYEASCYLKGYAESLQVYQVIELAQKNPEQLISLIICGANRAPLENWLGPFSRALAFDWPLIINQQTYKIPVNLKLFLLLETDDYAAKISNNWERYLSFPDFPYSDHKDFPIFIPYSELAKLKTI